MDVFPLPRSADYQYSSGFGGKHHGVDIFASEGTPVLAVASGTARAARDRLGGNVVYLRANDGARYYYAHLQGWSGELAEPASQTVNVRAGDQLGTLGRTGNAAGGPPHLHLELRELGKRGPSDPFPELVFVDPKAAPALPAPVPLPPTLDASPASSAAPSSAPSSSSSSGAGFGLVALALLWALSRRPGQRWGRA